MPGMSILYDLTGSRLRADRRTLESLESARHYEWYEQSVLVDDEHLFLGWTGYGEYPITVFDSPEFYICLEGLMYGIPRAETRAQLEKLCGLLFSDPEISRSDSADWLMNADGDFLVCILNKHTGELCIVNDALGRLPVYYRETGNGIILSRELRFITNLADRIDFDRAALAQYLLLGYPLGDKTLFDRVSRLGPASVIRTDPRGRRLGIETLLSYNTEEIEKGRPSEEYAGMLAESIRESCRDRAAAADEILVALSGGLDSRTIAAGLAQNETPFTSMTFVDSLATTRSEAAVAEKVAGALGSDWRTVRTGPARGRDALRLLRMKNGMNFLGMSFSLPLCLELRRIYGGGATLFTGEGGDKLLPDIRPPARLADVDRLADYVASVFAILPLDTVSALTRIERSEIIAGLRERLEAYAERDMKMKCIHFLIFERNFKWLFEGEDRNRAHLWVASPFYSFDFFTSALRCPVEYKTRYRLYRDLLRNLSSEAAAIDYARWMIPLDSKKIDFHCYLREIYLSLPAALRRGLARARGNSANVYEQDSSLVRCLHDQLERCAAISEYLSADEARRNLRMYPKPGVDNLFTITSVIEEFLGERSSIEDYLDSTLIG